MEASLLERATSAVENLIGTHCDTCEAQIPSDPATIVRAVLQAIKTPGDDRVYMAGVTAGRKHGVHLINESREIWQAMIDSLLADQDEFIIIPRLVE